MYRSRSMDATLIYKRHADAIPLWGIDSCNSSAFQLLQVAAFAVKTMNSMPCSIPDSDRPMQQRILLSFVHRLLGQQQVLFRNHWLAGACCIRFASSL